MATDKNYLNFILEQLSLLDNITYRSMMGEYIIYYRSRIAAYVCDDRLLVKPVPSALALMPNATLEAPYDGAKEMLLVEEVDDREFLQSLFLVMYSELSEPKAKNNKNH